MDRRAALTALVTTGVAWTGWAQASPALATQARRGGVMLIRHASTEPGIGDPAGFTLGQCGTQRNLSEAGRAEALAIGAWFRHHGLQPEAVLSSQWCRCRDTSRIAFGRLQDWPALNSTFAEQGQPEGQLAQLRGRLSQLPEGVLEVWVTHQVIMTALTGAYPAMAEGFILDHLGALRARGTMHDFA
ncbi:MAG: histidine phosphatase family protein [Limnohabitans sp.]